MSPAFDGQTYSPKRDEARLSGHLARVKAVMSGGDWWTLRELARHVGCSEASASARLRDLRKERHGSHTVERTHIEGGLWMYRLERAP